MGCRNKIRHEVDNPLSNENSDFYLPLEQRVNYIRFSLYKEKRENPLFKKAKYIYVYKDRESKNTYRLKGLKRRMRYYGISILTDDNNYYYNEYRSKHATVSLTTASDMSKIFLEGYKLDYDTTIAVDSSIGDQEPIMIFLQTVARTIGIPIRKRTVVQMLKRITSTIPNLITMHNKKETDIRHKRYIVDALHKRGWLDFLPEKIITQIRDRDADYRKKNIVTVCALGILYLHKSVMQASNKNRV